MIGTGVESGAIVAAERRGYAQALKELRAHLGRVPAVELYGAHGALGAAIAAGLADGAGPLLYVVADEETAEARAHDLGFFLSSRHPRTGSEPPAMRSDEQSSSSRDAKPHPHASDD